MSMVLLVFASGCIEKRPVVPVANRQNTGEVEAEQSTDPDDTNKPEIPGPVTPMSPKPPGPTVPPNPTPGATPMTPAPSMDNPPTGSNGDLGKRLLIGYWHNFENGSGFIRLSDISPPSAGKKTEVGYQPGKSI